MKLQNIKIGTRMRAGFAAVLGLMIVISFVGMINMRNLRDTMNRIVDINTQRLIAANRAGNALREIGISIRSIFATKDPNERTGMQSYIGKQTDVYNDGIKKIEAMTNINDSRGLELLAQVKAAQDTAIPLRSKAIELLMADKDQEALDLLNNETRPAIHKWIVAIDELVDHQSQRIKYRSEEAERQYNRTNTLMLIFGIVAVGFAVAISLILTKSITKPLKETVVLSKALANGDLTIHADAESTINSETGQLLTAMDQMARTLQGIIGELKLSADSMASASHELSASSEQMSRGVAEQSARASQIATSSAQMSQTVIDVAKNASDIASSAAETAATAKEGEAIVSKSVQEVKEIASAVAESSQLIISLGERSQQIGQIINVIKDIADQTNLLALNAAIEAARAGEQGRGFAVVADEVRKLAERTAKATSEIGGMIGAIQSEVDQAVASMGAATGRVDAGVGDVTRAGNALHKIVESVDGLQSMVQQVASATEEMSAVSETVSNDVETVATVANNNSESAKEIAASASGLARLASTLQDLVAQFKL